MRTGKNNPGSWVSLLLGGHLADDWRIFSGQLDIWRTLVSLLDLTRKIIPQQEEKWQEDDEGSIYRRAAAGP